MEVKIERMGINGEGIAYDNKRLLFVLQAFIGEVVEVEVIEKHDTYSICRVKRIVKRSPDRCEHACKVYNRCQACTLLPIKYEKQTMYKRDVLVNTLMKYAKVKANKVDSILTCSDPLYYRNSLKLPFSMRNNGLVVGMYQANSNDFVSIPDCVVHEKQLDAMKQEIVAVLHKFGYKAYSNQNKDGLRYLILRGLSSNYQCTIVTTKVEIHDACVQALLSIDGLKSLYQSIHLNKQSISLIGDSITLLGGSKRLKFHFMNFKLQVSPRSFFQLNTKQAERLYHVVNDMITPTDTIVEAYCGIGVMSLMLSNKAAKVIGIENVKDAVANARRNADVNKIKNVEFICGDAGREMVKLASQQAIDVLVVDPPRTGLDDTMLQCIIASKVKQIVYVSCNPSTLAKNLAVLQSTYEVKRIVPVDMFCNTAHVESVVLLSLK